MGMIRFLLGSMCRAFAASWVEQEAHRPRFRIDRLSLSDIYRQEVTGAKQWRAYLDRVDDGVEDGGEAAAADAHLRLRLKVLEPYLDRGHVDPNPAE